MSIDLDTIWPDLEARVRERGVRATARDLGLDPMMVSRGVNGSFPAWRATDLFRLLELLGYTVSVRPPRRSKRKDRR